MTATYTFDIVSTLDGFAAHENADWGGFWGKAGPELLEHRLAQYPDDQRMVLGANTFRQFTELLGPNPQGLDPLNARMRDLPTTVVSTTLSGPQDWPDVTGVEPIFQGAADFDLELLESRTLDGHTLELVYRPTLH